MAGSAHGGSSGAAAPGESLTAAPEPVRLLLPVLVDAVAAVAAARTEPDVAAACLPALLGLPGVRAAAVVQRQGRSAVVLASLGYDCGAMSAGTALPLEAALPVTESVRTGRTVVQGSGPAWAALPTGRGLQTPGALLLSLTGGPPAPADVARLERLALVVGDGLRRAAGQASDGAALAVVTSRLRTVPLLAGADRVELALRNEPLDGEAGGDVLACLPDGRGGTWLVAADVCGSGVPAALVAAGVRTALRACARTADGPADLLAAVESAVADDVAGGAFVTAAAVRLSPDGRSARVASAGHPPPVVVHGREAHAVAVEPGPPVALEGEVLPPLHEVDVDLPDGAVLLLHTDGLTERRTGGTVSLLDPVALATDLPADLERAADRVLASATAVGAAHDDVSLLLARPRTS